jgi:outer membrane receptor for ferrienterochelin and colicins
VGSRPIARTAGHFGALAFGIVLAAFSTEATAQDAIEDYSILDLLGTVEAASLQEESVSKAPSSVTVFTQAEITRMGIRTLERLLNFVPGFQGTTDNGNGLFRVATRGRSTTAHEYVLVLVDGQRLNDVYSGGATDALATENIEQVEIIRGPGSALYGANAFLAVVNIKTNRKANNITAGAGNLNSRYFVLNLAKQLADLESAASLRFYSDDGFAHESVADVTGRLGTASDPTQAVDGHLTLERKGLALSLQHRQRLFSGKSCCTPYSQYSDRSERAQSSLQLSYERELKDGLQLHAAASVARDRSLAFSAQFPPGTIPDIRSGVTLAETYVFGTFWAGLTLGANFHLRWAIPPRWSWLNGSVVVGADYGYVNAADVYDISSHDASWQYQGDLYRFPRPSVNRTVAAGFAQTKLDILSQLQLTAGARFDRYSDFGTSLSPRAALVYGTHFHSDVKVMYGRAFRAPSFGELYGGSRRVAVSTSNPLRAETVDTFEAAYTQQILDYASVSVTYFRNRLDNIIQPPENGLPYRNLGTSSIRGLEFELRSRDIGGLGLLATYTHLIPSEEERESLLVPLHFGSAAMTYSWKPLTLNLNAILRGESMVGGYVLTSVSSLRFLTHRQPAHAVVNMHLQAQVTPALGLSVVLENALDRRYDRSDDPHPSPGLLMRGRTFLLELKLAF